MSKLYENVANRYIKSSEEGHITMDEELRILEYLVQRYKLTSLSDFAKEQNISYNGAKKRINSGKVMYIELMNQKFIIQ